MKPYCSACDKVFKNINSFENHENSKKHKDNIAKMTFDIDIDVTEDEDEAHVDDVGQEEEGKNVKLNGETEEEGGLGNSTSDNDVRETLSDNDDTEHSEIQVFILNFYQVLCI